MNRLLVALSLVFTLCLAASSTTYAADWVITDTSCRIWRSDARSSKTPAWSGECVNGFASGDGQVTWFLDGLPAEREIVSSGAGATMKDGRIAAALDYSRIKYVMHECDRDQNYIAVGAFVPRDIDLSFNEVVEDIFEHGKQYGLKKCPKDSTRLGCTVTVLFDGDLPDYEYLDYRNKTATAQGQSWKDNSWSLNGNRARKKWEAENARMYQAALDARRLEANRKREEEAAANRRARDELRKRKEEQRLLKEASEKEKQAERKKVQQRNKGDFDRRYGVKTWMTLSQLEVNPFAHQGKAVALHCTFTQMISKDRAIFSSGLGLLVAFAVPSDAFQQQTEIVLAGTVEGNTSVKVPILGETTVPTLRYFGHYACKSVGCPDIVDQ